MSNDLCKKCFFYDEPLCSYQYNVKRDVDICKYFKAIPQTVFDRITASPEVLAEKLVYCVFNAWGESHWKSTVIGEKKFPTLTKAIAATVARLKEVAEDD
jgi:hypothetical protein